MGSFELCGLCLCVLWNDFEYEPAQYFGGLCVWAVGAVGGRAVSLLVRGDTV